MSSNLTASAKFMVMGMANIRKIGMRANSRNWLLVIGLLFIVAACVAAYLITAPAGDFIFDGPQQHGLPGLYNLYGFESPGLTSSLAIARYLESLIAERAD